MSSSQVFCCSRCHFQCDPIGVTPSSEGLSSNQRFVFCQDCRTPAVINNLAARDGEDCIHCGSLRLSELDRCPQCESPSVRWLSPSSEALAASVEVSEEESEEMAIKYLNLGGCMLTFLAVMSLGVGNLAIWYSSRRWPVFADEQGVTLKNGARIPWARIERIEHLTTQAGGSTAQKLIFHLDRGQWSLPIQRLEEPDLVSRFIMERIPDGVHEELSGM